MAGKSEPGTPAPVRVLGGVLTMGGFDVAGPGTIFEGPVSVCAAAGDASNIPALRRSMDLCMCCSSQALRPLGCL
jgi:hypothetical protein